jgi:hypothetical protein
MSSVCNYNVLHFLDVEQVHHLRLFLVGTASAAIDTNAMRVSADSENALPGKT